MTLFVYITDTCRDDAKRHGVSEAIERLRASVEETQSLSQFDPFPPPYHVKKKLTGRQPRLVAKEKKVGGHLVVVFLTVMIRGSREYEQDFCNDPVVYGARHFDDLVSDAMLAAFVDNRTALGQQPAKPDPSDVENELLYGAFSHAGLVIPGACAQEDALDRIVCESHEWVEQVAQSRIQNQLTRLAPLCTKALSGDDGLQYLPSSEKQGWGIWSYRRAGYVLLLRVVDGVNTSTVEAEVRQAAADLDAGETELLLKASRRAYPATVLTDDELWIDLEREEIANMALSPEESEVLKSARHSDTPFPLFINGRAGSGKSTILQYLFADILFAYGTRVGFGIGGGAGTSGAPGCPLYLTANGELLRNARNFVHRLLTGEAQFLDPDDGLTCKDMDLPNLLDEAFREFHPFMLSLLPREIRSRFQNAKHIDYPRFRRLWEQRFGKDPKASREYGPDLSWHVIRSYIKGMGAVELLSPEDYGQLPENQLTVTEQTFAAVYEQVWLRWYSGVREEGYWDDQDLARCILDHDLAPRSYSAVFCDEAQDFTRIELEVLLRLSLYSNRSLPPDAVSRVPFAFAGDEFQTLNPTGFRWDSVKAAFVEKFIYELDPGRRTEKADLNYRELHYNYRSSEPIVRLCNLVQALRSATFGIPELRPQRPWLRQRNAPAVLFYKSGDAGFWSSFGEQAGAYVVIVPCNEGEEAEFVAKDPNLREHIELVDGIPRNVLSAGRAKGCEYPAVVIYGFGDQADKDFCAPLGETTAGDADSRQLLSLQYFINRVYVAVSRPKSRLVIVDGDDGLRKLWLIAKDEFARERLVGALKRGAEVWASEIGGMVVGRPGDLSRDDVPDRLENARAFEEDGRARRDAYLMMQAASAYRESDDIAKWRECRARALDFEDKALESGTAYAEAGLLEDARRCLWRAERPGWLKLIELTNDHPELLASIEVQWAKAIQSKPDVRTATDVIERFLQRTDNDPRFAQASYGEPIWQAAVEALLDRLVGQAVLSIPKAVAAGMLQMLDRLEGFGIRVAPKLLAEFCFVAEEYKRAADGWEEQGDRRSARYFEARAKSSPYPECLEFWGRLNGHERISSEFEAHPSTVLNAADSSTVIAALLKLDKLDRALALATQSGSGDGALAVALAAHRERKDDLANHALTLSMAIFVEQGEWDSVTSFVANGALGNGEEWRDKEVRSWLKDMAFDLKISLVKALARSDKLPSAPPRSEKIISQFLKDFLRVKDNKWNMHISYLEAGAAHERTGRITDSLMFYEAALRENLRSKEQLQIRMRWLAVKSRQLQYERSRQKSDPKQGKAIEAEIRVKTEDWKLARPAELPEYPDFEAQDPIGTLEKTTTYDIRRAPVASAIEGLVNPPQTHAGPALPVGVLRKEQVSSPPAVSPRGADDVRDAAIEIAGLRVEVKRDKKLCLLTHLETMDTARLEWAGQRVVGLVDIKNGDGCWEIPAWGLSIELPNCGSDVAVLRMSGIMIDLAIRR